MKELKLKGSKVLVTGGAGFIGSALVRELEKKGCRVTVIDNLCAGKREHLRDTKAELIIGDVRNEELLREIKRRDQPEFVFHLAAEPYIPKGYQNPDIMFEVNTLGTVKILKVFGKSSRRIIYWSTSEVYGTAKVLPMSESHPTLPHSIYALAKFAGDRACFLFWKERKTPVVMLRQFNCFGPREAQPYIIPELLSQFTRHPEYLTLGNIYAKRDFTYVDDAVRGVIKLAEVPKIEGQAINWGRGKDWSVEELANITARVMKVKDFEIRTEKKRLRPYDVDELLCDNSLFLRTIDEDFKFISIEEGLRKTYEWYKKHGSSWSWERT